jgi:SAM-dependent methyltransferase
MTGGGVFEPTIECPCDRSLLERRFTYTTPPEGETAFDWAGQEYVRGYDRCQACGHWFGAHALDLGDLYGGDYVESTYGDRMASTFERIIALPTDRSDNFGRRQRLLEFAAQRLGADLQPTLLDVGSGLGVFPYAMKEAGWACTALDPDPKACAHISARVGVSTINADFLNIETAKVGTYDVVTLNKVIEHVDDPCVMLRRAAEVTRPEGFVYVEVPDGDGAAPQGQGREEFFVEHHHVFSTASLSATVERSGLLAARIDRVIEPSGKFTLVCFAVPQAA